MTDIPTLIRDELSSQHAQRSYGEITPDMSLTDDLHCDQLDVISIAIAVEMAFDVEIGDAEVEGWRTVSDVIRSVEARRVREMEGQAHD